MTEVSKSRGAQSLVSLDKEFRLLSQECLDQALSSRKFMVAALRE